MNQYSSLKDIVLGDSSNLAMARPSVLNALNKSNRRLEKLLADLRNEANAQSELLAIAREVMTAVELNQDVALACIFLSQIAGTYAVRHCIETAIVATLVAQRMRKTREEMLVITAAALTMNVGMLRHQNSFNKSSSLTSEEMSIVRRHPEESVGLLRDAGVEDDSRKRIEALETELGIIGRESAIGIDIGKRKSEADDLLPLERERLAGLESRWNAERALVDELLALRAKLRDGALPVEGTGSSLEAGAEVAAAAASAAATAAAPAVTPQERAVLMEQLKAVQAKLTELQGETPLILPTVDYQAVAAVVGDWTGIPVGRMAKNEMETILKVASLLSQRVIGQDHAMEMIAKRIQTSRAGLDNPSKPIGVFMLAGTSGVGKTETALALAEALYGGEQNLITINMSEYQEAHTVSTLKGAPPGYVGYGEGGVLTEAVRRKPYSVVLLDEVEKAHPDVDE
eukprot:gene28967-32712_t